jgi:hypothetical protein
MELSRNTKSETLEKNNFHEDASPDKDIKRTNINLVNVSNKNKKLSPLP